MRTEICRPRSHHLLLLLYYIFFLLYTLPLPCSSVVNIPDARVIYIFLWYCYIGPLIPRDDTNTSSYYGRDIIFLLRHFTMNFMFTAYLINRRYAYHLTFSTHFDIIKWRRLASYSTTGIITKTLYSNSTLLLFTTFPTA